MDMSINEMDVHLSLNIYLYENKELTIIYKKNYIQHFKYYYNILESEFGDFLKIWRDENILINEKDEIISFFNLNKPSFVIVKIEQKKVKRQKWNKKLQKCIFDKKSNYCYLVAGDEKLEFQIILLYQISPENGMIFIKNIYLPFLFSDIILTKKGHLLGVAKNTITVYYFYHHLGRYAPQKTISTSLCLLNI